MIVCDVCPRGCKLEDDGKPGFCGVRANRDGANMDVLYQRFYPGLVTPYALGFGVWFSGCNLRCYFCTADVLWSTDGRNFETVTEHELVDRVLVSGWKKMSFIGGEPAIHPEYILEGAELLRGAGVRTCLCTNGYAKPWLASQLGKAVDRVVVGIKGSMSQSVYERMNACASDVLDSMKVFYETNGDFWIKDFVGPSFADVKPSEHEAFARWVCDELSPSVPIRVGGEIIFRDLSIPCPRNIHWRPSFVRAPPPTVDVCYLGGNVDTLNEMLALMSVYRHAGLTDVNIDDLRAPI